MKHALLLAVTIGVVAVRAQPPRDGTAAGARPVVVSGSVLTQGGDPIPNARVGVQPAGQGSPVVLTDANGAFTIALPTPRHHVVASKTGYARRDVAVAGDAPLTIRLERTAAISGRVVDELGDPVIGAVVSVDTVVPSADGKPPLVGTIRGTQTDDRGEYRFGGLPAATVTVAVAAPSGVRIEATINGMPSSILVDDSTTLGRPTAQKTYYPDARAAADAEPIGLQPGAERDHVDFVVPAERLSTGSIDSAGVNQQVVSSTLTTRGAGVVRGRVMSTEGRPIPRALVRIAVVAPPERSPAPRPLIRRGLMHTDEDGAFEFADLLAGTYQVTAAKSGFSPVGAYGPLSGGSSISLIYSIAETFDLADGAKREHVDLTLAPWRALSGRVVDERGDPVEGAAVMLYQSRYVNGARRLVEAFSSRFTNDLGQYRIYGVAPGRYIVSASIGAVSSTDVPGYGRSFFPGTSNPAEAQYVAVSAAQDTVGIEVALSRVATARVSGTLLNASGEPLGGGISLVSSRSASMVGTSVGARISSDGSFEFPNVPPGSYVIQVYQGRHNSFTEGEFAALPIAVSGSDVTGIVMQTSLGSTITGHVVFDTVNPAATPPFARVEISPELVDSDLSPGSGPEVAVDADGTFRIAGVHGPRRLQATRTPPGWALKEVRVNGGDVTDRALSFGTNAQSLSDVEVVLTDRINTIDVAVTGDRSKPAAATVLVFSSDRDRWYSGSRFLRKAAANADGAATIAGLPSGAYHAIAIARPPAEGPDAWQDPEFLESLIARATSVSLGEGDTRAVGLRIR